MSHVEDSKTHLEQVMNEWPAALDRDQVVNKAASHAVLLRRVRQYTVRLADPGCWTFSHTKGGK